MMMFYCFQAPPVVFIFIICLIDGKVRAAESNSRIKCLSPEETARSVAELERQGLVNREKDCLGTANAMSGAPTTIYLEQYRRYKNCEVVVGNLEISSLGCNYSNYTFLHTITEVTGIVPKAPPLAHAPKFLFLLFVIIHFCGIFYILHILYAYNIAHQ